MSPTSNRLRPQAAAQRAEQPKDAARSARQPEVVGFFLEPNFAMMGFATAIEPLRQANRLSGKVLYQWKLVSTDGKPVAASNGIELKADHAVSDQTARFDAVYVCGGMESPTLRDRSLSAWLNRLARHGCRIGSISGGSYALARAGLLSGHKSCMHWEYLQPFREEFPDLDVSDDIFEIDRDRATCSGGTSSLDMMLHLIRLDHGHDLAMAVAEQAIHTQVREANHRQRLTPAARLGVTHPKLLSVIGLMELNLEQPLDRADLAKRVGLSVRQVERLFHKYLDTRPMRYYLALRLARARQLLTQTDRSILDVALACGFETASHFSKCFHAAYDRTPSNYRQSLRRVWPTGAAKPEAAKPAA